MTTEEEQAATAEMEAKGQAVKDRLAALEVKLLFIRRLKSVALFRTFCAVSLKIDPRMSSSPDSLQLERKSEADRRRAEVAANADPKESIAAFLVG